MNKISLRILGALPLGLLLLGAAGCAIADPRLPSHDKLRARLAALGYTLAEPTPDRPNPNPDTVSFRWRRTQRFRYKNDWYVDLLCDPTDSSKVLGIHSDFRTRNWSDHGGRGHYNRFRQFVRDVSEMDTAKVPTRPYGFQPILGSKGKGAIRHNGLKLEYRVLTAWDANTHDYLLCDDRW